MKKGIDSTRLSTAMNARFDLVAPKRELENAEKQIEKVRREAQKTYEREKQQLQKKLETLPTTRKSFVLDTRRPSRIPTIAEDRRGSSPPTSTAERMAHILDQGRRTSKESCVQDSAYSAEEGPADKQADALKQLKFLYDCAVQMVAGADVQPKGGKQKGGSEVVEFEEQATPSKGKDQMERKETVAAFRGGNRSLLDPGGVQRKRTALPTTPADPGFLQLEYQGIPSQAVQLMTMVRMLSTGQSMDSKTVKALTAVIEETRIAVKAVKGGMDPERAQERLIKKLTELLELVKPKGSDLIISPEELLRCSYLRLSKDNVARLEEMIRERGMDPGIHCHSDMTDFMAQMDDSNEMGPSNEMLPMMPIGETSNIQPVSVYMTKPGAPIDKSRIAKPDNTPGPSMEEEMARLKKFRAT